MNFWDQALHWYLDAFEYNPKRAEPLHKIARHYRNKGDTDLAYFFAKQGSSIPYPKDELLFIAHDVYDYQFLEDLSIAAYYTAHKDDGFKAANDLILKKGIPHRVKNQAMRNILFYVQNLQIDEIKPIEFIFRPFGRGKLFDLLPDKSIDPKDLQWIRGALQNGQLYTRRQRRGISLPGRSRSHDKD